MEACILGKGRAEEKGACGVVSGLGWGHPGLWERRGKERRAGEGRRIERRGGERGGEEERGWDMGAFLSLLVFLVISL